MKTATGSYLDGYLEWLRANSSEREVVEGLVELTLPFLDRHNDHIQVYVEEGGNKLLLTDDGEVLRDLELVDFKLSSPKRRMATNAILRGLGLDPDPEGELSAVASPDKVPAKLHALIQAMLAIGNLAIASPASAESLFREDVAMWLARANVPFEEGVELAGNSGLPHKMEFVLPPLKERPEAVLQAFPSLARHQLQSYAFAVLDCREARDEPLDAFAVLNDGDRDLTRWKTMLLKCDITPIRWTTREQLLYKLTG